MRLAETSAPILRQFRNSKRVCLPSLIADPLILLARYVATRACGWKAIQMHHSDAARQQSYNFIDRPTI
jgi:hypothetical protein